MDSPYTKPFPVFPNRNEHARRWRELAREIAENRHSISETPTLTETPGELIITGSGIEAVGFTSADELRLRQADHVFYCVADPATVVYLKNIRPDAYDLYVLYDDTKIRYTTYMQMTEAMLHYVRKGKQVVTVFYGHPGIFVLSTHRAVQIARREGHRATMHAGVSALDTLCADLGVDPAQPGLQTFEATDMLVRKRRPDPTLHVVLWQVGLIGELGFRRQGCLNSRFCILLDYLEEIYGPDQEVINYIGSKYPGVDPLCEKHTLRSLRQPHVQTNVTGISTFYLPPVQSAASDEDMLIALGLIKPGQCVNPPTSVLRKIDEYGQKESKAFDDFARFSVPMDYHWQADTPSARFILALREDGKLRTKYQNNPSAAVVDWGGGLSTRDQRRLAMRDMGAMQIAAKGVRTSVAPESAKVIRELLTKEPQSRSLLRTARNADNAREAVEMWMVQHGHSAEWDELQEDLEITLRLELYPWTGCYLAKNTELSVVVHGLPGNVGANRVYINGEKIQNLGFHHGQLYWRAEDGNNTNGSLRADLTPRGARRMVGSIWGKEEQLGSMHHVVALEHSLDTQLPLASLCGSYRMGQRSVRVEPCKEDGAQIKILVDEKYAEDAEIAVDATSLHLNGFRIPFSAAQVEDEVPAFARGEYCLRLVSNGMSGSLLRIDVNDNTMRIDDKEVTLAPEGRRTWLWTNGPEAMPSGKLSIVMDPISLTPMLFGETERGARLRGMRLVCDHKIAKRAECAELGMEQMQWAWKHLVYITASSSEKGGLFLWHGWTRSVSNLRRLRRVLRMTRVLPQ